MGWYPVGTSGSLQLLRNSSPYGTSNTRFNQVLYGFRQLTCLFPAANQSWSCYTMPIQIAFCSFVFLSWQVHLLCVHYTRVWSTFGFSSNSVQVRTRGHHKSQVSPKAPEGRWNSCVSSQHFLFSWSKIFLRQLKQKCCNYSEITEVAKWEADASSTIEPFPKPPLLGSAQSCLLLLISLMWTCQTQQS